MGYEDRDYYRDESSGGLGGFQFNGRSMVMTLIYINVAIFFLDTFTNIINQDGSHWLSELMGIKEKNLWYVWTYLTYGFAHASFDTQTGVWHVVMNMFTLFFFGPPLEQKVGKYEFLRFYLISIVVAGLGWVLLRILLGTDGNAFIVGASGAVSAVLVGFIYLFPRQEIRLMGIIPMPAWVLGVVMLFSNLSYAFRAGSHVAWEAHAAGALFGFLYFKYKWNFNRFDFAMPSFASKPKLRVHDPGTSVREEKLKAEADKILEKISEQGEQSLTSKEKKILNKYSKKLRNKQ